MSGFLEDVEWGEPENPFNPAGGTRKDHSGFLEWLHIGKDANIILILEPKRFLYDNDSVAIMGCMKCLANLFDTYTAGEAFR